MDSILKNGLRNKKSQKSDIYHKCSPKWKCVHCVKNPIGNVAIKKYKSCLWFTLWPFSFGIIGFFSIYWYLSNISLLYWIFFYPHLLVQLFPSPVYPELHVHVNDPVVSVQAAFLSQSSSFRVHSSLSKKTKQ